MKSEKVAAGKLKRTLLMWLDSGQVNDSYTTGHSKSIDWLRCLPFIGMHVACFAVIQVGWSPIAVAVALFMYMIRMFAITAFYHRYFSHKSFRTSRTFQFVGALLGAMAVQRGPLWWAAHHRHHHVHSDGDADTHSPVKEGFWWSHAGWFLSRENFPTRWKNVKDWSRYPELVFLDRFDTVVPLLYAASMFGVGVLLELLAPNLGTNGWQMLVWGFVISTVVLYHATFTINSLAHRFGKKNYATKDQSRNNFWLALLTFGEGWHNNHHYYPRTVRQGFQWWEVDLTYAILKLLSVFGLVWDMKTVPAKVLSARRDHIK